MEHFRRVDLEYRLASPGGVTPNTQKKSWFFALPPARDTADGWRELLHRIFYDANTLMRLREPGDPNWLALDVFRVSEVDPRHQLGWTGATDAETTARFLPWFLQRVVWVYATCWLVDAAGRYDGLDGYSFSELQLYRLLDAGQATEAEARGFLGKLFPKPGAGEQSWNERAARLRNIDAIRPTHQPRKAPDAQPWISGPPQP